MVSSPMVFSEMVSSQTVSKILFLDFVHVRGNKYAKNNIILLIVFSF